MGVGHLTLELSARGLEGALQVDGANHRARRVDRGQRVTVDRAFQTDRIGVADGDAAALRADARSGDIRSTEGDGARAVRRQGDRHQLDPVLSLVGEHR